MCKRRYSLKMKATLVMLAAMGISVIFYYAVNYFIGSALDSYFASSSYIERQTDKTAEEFQDYVTKNQISSSDTEALNAWGSDNPLIYYVILKGGKVIYPSEYKEDEMMIPDDAAEDSSPPAAEEESYYESDSQLYDIQFADGAGRLYVVGFFDYEIYAAANYIELGVSVLLFLFIFLFFLQRKIRYVHQLEEEVKILEGGGMDKQITVKGGDELSELAFGLEQMRLSLNENIREKKEIMEVNNRLVTGMAHDLRTPLTALLLYTELLSQGKYKDEKEMEQYLKKTAHKANQIKQMSDDLFERFYITKNEDIMLEVPEKLCYIFENRLSDLVMFLHSQGFRVDCDTDWPEVKLSVLPEYMDRILDNIASNLLKYADKTEPVTIVFSMQDQPEKQITMIIRNKIDQNPEDVSSTCVGVANIEQMMHKMKGTCKVENDGQFYEISLVFPAYE